MPAKSIGVVELYDELISHINKKLPKNGESAEKAIYGLISGAKNALIHSQNSKYTLHNLIGEELVLSIFYNRVRNDETETGCSLLFPKYFLRGH